MPLACGLKKSGSEHPRTLAFLAVDLVLLAVDLFTTEYTMALSMKVDCFRQYLYRRSKYHGEKGVDTAAA